MPIDVGATIEARWVRGTSHANQTPTLTVIRPDGTTTTPTVTENPVGSGTYTAPVPTAGFPGRQLFTWTSGDDRYTDVADVWPADPRFIVSVDDAAEGLRWRPADRDVNLESLRLYCAAATEVIEDIVGAVLVRTIVQPSDGGRTGVALWERPDAIISVTVGGTVTTDYIPNLNAAIVYAGNYGERFPDGRQNIVVTYRVGSTQIPPNVRLAARELVRHLWQIGQQATTTTVGTDGTVTSPSGFAVPKRVLELCAASRGLPGMA